MPERVGKRARDQYLVEVILFDGTHHRFNSRELDVMLDNDWVMKFKRSSGWVTVGVDPVRAKPRIDACPLYYGRERRMSGNAPCLA